jgi:PKD repeat protein
MYSQITITNAAKEGALVASQGGTWQSGAGCSDANTVMCGALTEAQGGFIVVDQTAVNLSPAVCDKDAPYPAGGPPTVTVEVTAPFRLVTPIVASIVGNNIVLHASADAECLAVPAVTFPSLPAPTAAFTASRTTINVGQSVTFDASASSSPGATITGYNWSFGASTVVATQTYNTAGTFNVTLTVTDSRGQSDTATATITVNGSGPTATPPPSCPTVSFTVSPKNPASQHKVDLDGVISDGSNGWTWVWSGDITRSGQHLNNVQFPATGNYSVTLTATKGSCAPTVTQPVTAP